ncbi:MAG: FAD-binding oxidoreductase [Blastocatellia bacterium]
MTISRREFLDFLKLGCTVAVLPAGVRAVGLAQEVRDGSSLVNDIHSQLNPTRVSWVVRPATVSDLNSTVTSVASEGKSISIAGGRHSMGGQQFGTDSVLLDMRSLNRVIEFDRDHGLVEVEAGILWPELLDYLSRAQSDGPSQWGIVQKQTGADRLSIGGALASNVHGRGLKFKPIIDQVQSFRLMDHTGAIRRCDRSENAELFRLAIGGYGLFGIVTSVQLRLWPRKKVRRVVEFRNTSDIPGSFQQRIADGYLYGDFQFATDSKRDSFLRRGVFSCYQPVDPDTPLTQNPTRFHPADWERLTYYSHKYKRRAFDAYTSRYVATSGQIYWADSQLSGAYVDNYHAALDRKLKAKTKATEMITEIYVPRQSLVSFMEDARRLLRDLNANVIYGTVRLIEKDEESFLRWARESFACVIFNLHVTHDAKGVADAQRAFQALIDLGIRYRGSYYLTYHRWATKQQIETCYPQFAEFLSLKLKYDPYELFQSDWYRHHRKMFGLDHI